MLEAFHSLLHRFMVQPLQWSKLGRWCILLLASWLLASPWVPLQVPEVVPNQSVKRPCWQVSSFGRCRDTRGRITLGWLTAGYRRVMISGHKTYVHRVVAYPFLGAPPSEAAWQVNHIDGNHSNNRKDNLEWTTGSENIRHSYATNPSRHKGGSKRARPVMIRPMGSCNWTRFSSIKLAADALSQPYSTVCRRCHRNSQMDGYEYKFAPVQQVELPGEEWRRMIDPRSGGLVSGRMVSSLGRITSKKTGRISFGSVRKDGYLRTTIGFGSKSHYQDERVHRLVAAAFLGLPPSPEHSQVNHKDGNKSNNAVENLEYVTPAENSAHHSASLKGCHPLSKAVLSRRYGTKEWTAHPSVSSAAETLGLHLCSVSACARGLRKRTGGFEFRFAEPEPHVVETLPGEEWRDVDSDVHLKDREGRKRRPRQRRQDMKVQWGWAALLRRFSCIYDDILICSFS